MAATGYPWGKASPATRIREGVQRANSGLAKAAEARFPNLLGPVADAARASRPLCEALEYLARAGLRARGEQNPVPGEEVASAVEAVHEALAALADSSPASFSSCFEGYVTAVESLVRSGEDAAQRGIRGTGGAGRSDPWGAFST